MPTARHLATVAAVLAKPAGYRTGLGCVTAWTGRTLGALAKTAASRPGQTSHDWMGNLSAWRASRFHTPEPDPDSTQSSRIMSPHPFRMPEIPEPTMFFELIQRHGSLASVKVTRRRCLRRSRAEQSRRGDL